ncbi:MAG TPA: polymer-forming cytoskeletal protein [Pseudolabrys sp.]|nr:polymer-forming cytoskeletal protein [Pseudolabrys sp.]
MFTQTKTQRDTVAAKSIEPRLNGGAADVISTFGVGMQITGNIICPGALQIFGRVTGEIQAAQLVICEGAKVEGKIIAQETVIQGSFNGTIHGNSVKLQGNAAVDGEIFNKSLTIEPNVQFEGVSRRLDRTVDVPGADHSVGLVPGPEVVG